MTDIGIVGAGAGAAAAAYVLQEAAPDASLTVLEKSGGLCGRAATRRRGDCTYDYGANYVKSDDPRVAELLTGTLDASGLVEAEGPVYIFDREGSVTPGRDADEHKWSYRAGLTQIAKRLFARTDATIERRTRVETVARDGDSWNLTDADGGEWGPFDVLLLNPPAPQTAELLRAAEWDHPVRARLAEAAGAVPYRSVWTAVLHYPFSLDVPYYALLNTDKEHEVGWISREECKPGHVPAGESLLIVQAGPEWSVEHYDDPSAENVAELAAHTAELLEDPRLSDPDWTDHQGWRYALADGKADPVALRSAEAHDLYCAGDWVAGEARVHAALRSGLEVGERMGEALGGGR
jgi:hypothetical protein